MKRFAVAAVAAIVAIVAVAAAGFAGGSLVARRSPAPPAPAAVAPPAPAMSAAELRAIVRSELAREQIARVAAEPSLRDETPLPAPAAAPPANQADFERARGLALAGISAGRWTRADRDALRASMATANQEQADEIASLLVVAVNDGSLAIERGVTPF